MPKRKHPQRTALEEAYRRFAELRGRTDEARAFQQAVDEHVRLQLEAELASVEGLRRLQFATRDGVTASAAEWAAIASALKAELRAKT
jgi:hypothetical protein